MCTLFARIHVSSILPLQRRKILLYDNSIVVKKVVEQIETLVDVSILVGNSRCPNYAQTLSALILVGCDLASYTYTPFDGSPQDLRLHAF